ncbi:MAG: hypothetical protein UX01_C0008G0027 [Candidatus Collierbacteria bacterium GW2011_GWB2_45_17]|uniref:Uncharacterized protein n=2 Tax=Candidatus Collieribacteriota TaxID=1752725 RepID=A0A0G1NNI9_9BACT|nr:MAG: hypothetical protein UW48_C0010G0013 [Microgenomates group bacterium GW2011_GWC1_44_23]KKT85779.1 MAG: hypothetical protein UW84_C0022G0011 [Candidatus Collierbacteria bacterium GW2011_GWA2_44_99]KKT94557.1 MAG: hypothetical protein UW96_C0019G0002 [Candidatus Collierbacteria bacterium GW2011_GWA1_45_15]KKT99659.1 MAG: hypothetical protein UX01_C0008G0027 [Candidatus Collierbacteria bacterium GW2011_GWB2_45_17]KKU07165.1 MAG: hypothetical protein UX11_C0019G0005 [Candidatus Collierbacte
MFTPPVIGTILGTLFAILFMIAVFLGLIALKIDTLIEEIRKLKR